MVNRRRQEGMADLPDEPADIDRRIYNYPVKLVRVAQKRLQLKGDRPLKLKEILDIDAVS